MDDSEYDRLAEAALRHIEAGLEAADADLDWEIAAGGILEIEFADGSKIIVNRQSAAQEIWVAARSGGFHYRWDGSAWRDSRGDEALYAALERLIAQQGGVAVSLA